MATFYAETEKEIQTIIKANTPDSKSLSRVVVRLNSKVYFGHEGEYHQVHEVCIPDENQPANGWSIPAGVSIF